ncbi:hypothetical protein MMC31_005364 [Peltigera leucophlebia]|nr:hypothetical protein [Peltigera leucophlebia]
MLNIKCETHECNPSPKSTGRERCYDDREEYSKRLNEDESRLFSRVNCKFEVILAQTVQSQNSSIRQDNSWGRFSISSKLFKRILAHLDVFPPFLDFVHAFGFKLNEDDENFGGYHRRIYRPINSDGGLHSFGATKKILLIVQLCDLKEEKALFSRVGVKRAVDYDVAFADVQKLQHLCKKMGKCLGILDTLLEIASGHQCLWNDIQNGRESYADFKEIDSELKMYTSRIRNHRQSVNNLLTYSVGIARILAHILEYRNDELLIKNSEELHRSSESAREIATAAKAEQEAVALILAKAQKDSSLVKILTFVAMLYLPASLIATLFTSNLIQLPSPEKAFMIGKLNVRLSKAFWLYPVLSLALMVLTLILVVVSARWLGSRKVAPKDLLEAERTLELGTVKG